MTKYYSVGYNLHLNDQQWRQLKVGVNSATVFRRNGAYDCSGVVGTDEEMQKFVDTHPRSAKYTAVCDRVYVLLNGDYCSRFVVKRDDNPESEGDVAYGDPSLFCGRYNYSHFIENMGKYPYIEVSPPVECRALIFIVLDD